MSCPTIRDHEQILGHYIVRTVRVYSTTLFKNFISCLGRIYNNDAIPECPHRDDVPYRFRVKDAVLTADPKTDHISFSIPRMLPRVILGHNTISLRVDQSHQVMPCFLEIGESCRSEDEVWGQEDKANGQLIFSIARRRTEQ